MAKATHIYVIADTPMYERAIQDQHAPTTMSCYLIPLEGRSEDEAVAEFIGSRQFPVGTVFGVAKATAVSAHRLAPRLETHDVKPGEQS